MAEKRDFEEYLTKRDFEIKGLTVPPEEEIDKWNNHPSGEGEKFNQKKEDFLENFSNTKEDQTDRDDPGDLYRLKRNAEQNLFKNTPEKDRRYLIANTLVEGRNKITHRYKGGHTSAESVVARVLNKERKWPVKNGSNEYVALTRVKFFFTPRGSNEKVYLFFEPGEKFFAPKSGENEEKRKEMLKRTILFKK